MWALIVCVLALAGCRRAQIPPAPQWDAGPIDAGGPDYTDSDGDGACDRTELSRGTDPSNPDTDGDGFPDGVELRLGFDATRTDSPDRTLLLYMTEAELETSRMRLDATVRGEGESFVGRFVTLPVSDPAMEDAAYFFTGAQALAANPMENVFEVIPDEQRFNRVIGRTQLLFEVDFQVPAGEELRGCKHAFPWRYQVKRDDGVLVFSRRYFVIVTPDGEHPENDAWCAPVGLCI